VGTKVLQHDGLAFGAAVEHHLLAANLAPQRFAVNFIGPTSNVPGIFDEHEKGFLGRLKNEFAVQW
jgi:hypothetical protein